MHYFFSTPHYNAGGGTLRLHLGLVVDNGGEKKKIEGSMFNGIKTCIYQQKAGKKRKEKTFPACLTKRHTVYCPDGADKGISINLLRLILGHLGMTRQCSPYTKCDRQRNPLVEECIIVPPAIEEAINAWQPRQHLVAIAAFSFFFWTAGRVLLALPLPRCSCANDTGS